MSDVLPRLPSRLPSSLEKARALFVESGSRLTYKEVGERYSVPLGTICNAAADESWPAMRSAHLEAKLRECDAKSAILTAVQSDRALMTKFTSVALAGLDKIATAIESVQEDRAAQTQAQALNTLSFAYVNFARGLHEVGILGISKTLNADGKEANGRWNPEMLQQINVTVQNLTAQQAAEPKGKPSGDAESGPAIPVDAK